MAEKDRIRTEKYLLTLLPEEAEMLKKSAFEFGLSRAEYLRNIIVAGSVTGRHWTMNEEQGKQLLYEINRIGNNINQVAYNTNVQAYASHPDWEKLEQNYKELLKLFAEIPFLEKEKKEEWQQQVSMLLNKQ